jgi:hypothetical protein
VQILEALNIRASIVHVDAAHEYKEVLRDAQDYWRILEAGGVMIGDDYHESWPGVIRAARDFAQKAGQQLIIDEPKWIVKKPG